MTVSRVSVAVLVGLFGLPEGEVLAEEAPERFRLSLTEAISRARESAPDVVLAKRTVTEAQASRVGAGVFLPVNPKVGFDVRPGVTRDAGTKPGFGLNAEAQFEVSNAAGARVREADRRTEIARAELSGAVLQARSRAWSAYVLAQIANLRVTQADEEIAIGLRVLNASQERVKAGAAGDIDVAAVESELAELRARRELVAADRKRALMELRQTLDLPADAALELTTPVDALDAPVALTRAVELAMKSRPELAVAQARVAYQETIDERLAREAAPKLGVYGGLDAAPASPIFGLVGLNFEIPVAQRNQGPRAIAQAMKETELDRLVLEKRRIEREVNIAHQNYESRLNQLKVLAEQAVPAAERTLRLVETGWTAGRFDVFRVTTAARDLARIRRQRLETLMEAWADRIALERAVGTELPISGGKS
jgi:outer membrane protein TolC